MPQPPTKCSLRRKVLLLSASAVGLVAASILILLLEIALRPAAYFWHNHSKYYLYYGFHSLVGKVGINPMSTFHGEYYKFPPHYTLTGAAGQSSETASINSHGFRGPDFATTKPPGIFRIVCLGESSTFGYRDGDQETYPIYLQKLLTERNFHAEVINAGFPYYNTGSILTLLKKEILDYHPDLITLYAGYNDTSWPTHISVSGRLALWIQSHSITYLVLKDNLNQVVGKVDRHVFDFLIPQVLRDEQFKQEDDLVARRYSRNVRSIVRTAKSHGIPVIVVKQPVTTHEGKYLSMSYEEENRQIRERFVRGEVLSNIEAWMLKQYRLTKELEQIAADEDLTMVDNIKIVDQDRRRLASWVHLTPEANQRLAEALALAIERYITKAP
jgi:lysophospholipase L1-like esterase